MGTVFYDDQELAYMVEAVLIFYGNAADDAIAQQVATNISEYWNYPNASLLVKGKWVNVQFNIMGLYAPDLTPEDVIQNLEPTHNFFRIEEQTMMDVSFVDGIGSNTGCFKKANLLQTGSTAAHEFGHTIGLDHPKNMDIRGKGVPGIMYPRGTIVDAMYQYNPLGQPGDSSNGGTMNPAHRQVTLHEIELLRIPNLSFDKDNKAVLGGFTSVWHQE